MRMRIVGESQDESKRPIKRCQRTLRKPSTTKPLKPSKDYTRNIRKYRLVTRGTSLLRRKNLPP